jgi:predicted Zn finger-like uncharacterized protein
VAEDSLEPLITQCPTCRTRFRVTETQLNAASGRVRCGACLAVFAGLEHLVLASGPRLKPGESANEALDALLDELRSDSEPRAAIQQNQPNTQPEPESPESRREGHSSASVKPLGNTERVAAPREDAAGAGGPEKQGAPVKPKADAEAAPALDGVAARKARRLKLAAASTAKPEATPQQPAIDTADARADTTAETPEAERAVAPAPLDLTPEELIAMPAVRRRRWWVPLGVVCAIVVLGAQVLYLQFDTWAKNPDIRPVYEWLCPHLKCQLPVMRSLDEIRSKNLVVRANPDVPGELMVDALIVNQARFAQPFPVIELRFSSMEGRPIAARRFKPDEYLAGELKGATMFAPLTPVHIALAIEDPGTDAVSYYIQFR